MKFTDDEPPRHSGGADARRELRRSLFLLGLIAAAALAGLAWEENWRKFARVGVGFAVYVGVMLLLSRAGAGAARGRVPFWAFACAGACAELASGWLRPGVPERLSLFIAPVAGLLVGGAHWLALCARRPLRERITAGRGTGQPSRSPGGRAGA